jgi:hypothetical protein
MKQLAVQSAEGRNGEIVVKLNGDDGPYEVALSVFDVSTLVSMLYAARAEAANQPVPSAPEAALPLHTIKIGDDADYEIMRVYVTGCCITITVLARERRLRTLWLTLHGVWPAKAVR